MALDVVCCIKWFSMKSARSLRLPNSLFPACIIGVDRVLHFGVVSRCGSFNIFDAGSYGSQILSFISTGNAGLTDRDALYWKKNTDSDANVNYVCRISGHPSSCSLGML